MRSMRFVSSDEGAGISLEDIRLEVEQEANLSLKPSEIVSELDRFIVGQDDAKRAVAIALRTRYRRQRLPETLRDEVIPHNILMVGPTGSGKTEIARRLAKLAHAPFVKVEATKFTEVGFHGRDVDTIIRDLVSNAVQLTRQRYEARVRPEVEQRVEHRILDSLLGPDSHSSSRRDRETWLALLREQRLEDRTITINVPVKTNRAGPGGVMLDNGMSMRDVMESLYRSQRAHPQMETRSLTVKDARPLLFEAEMERLLETVDVQQQALRAAEQNGIVFIDEIDKICSANEFKGGDASAEGVQRDLLPLIEGCNIRTSAGSVNTDHILFIASGAFHQTKPSDLLPELQGRLPIRVELQRLSEDDLYRILTEPEANLIQQQVALLGTEDVKVEFEDDAIRSMARYAAEINTSVEHIGARRLHTVIERIMEVISFDAPEMEPGTTISVTAKMVEERLSPLLRKGDLSKFIL